MTVYYALVNVSAVDGSVEILFGDHDRQTVEYELLAETCPMTGTRWNHATNTDDRVKIVTFPAADDRLIQAYVDQINRPIMEAAQAAAAARQSSDTASPVAAFDEALTEAIGEEVKLANDRIEQRATAVPAKPIAPAGTLVGTVPSAYPYLDAEGWDAAARHKLQFDTVTAEGIAAIPHVELTANQIRYAGDIGAIHVNRRTIPHRYRFSDVMEYAAARDAGEKPATVAKRHAKAAAQ